VLWLVCYIRYYLLLVVVVVVVDCVDVRMLQLFLSAVVIVVDCVDVKMLQLFLSAVVIVVDCVDVRMLQSLLSADGVNKTMITVFIDGYFEVGDTIHNLLCLYLWGYNVSK